MSTDSNQIALTIENFLPYMTDHQFGDLHFKVDVKTGLIAIIAIHSTKLGPALGGCRWIPYTSSADAVLDALRLARGMSYKAALTNLPYGGGKSVIMRPAGTIDTKAYFRKFGEFVQELGGRYITAVDSGTSLDEMDIIHEVTPYVASLSKHRDEPSPFTAEGVLRGMHAAIRYGLNKESFEGLHIAIKGVGKVGHHLATLLHERGARLTVADVNPESVQRCVKEFKAQVSTPDDIHALPCDVFSPCALGAGLNKKTIPNIKAKVIAGAANNQLARHTLAQLLHDKGILYAPDYVINAGGLIFATTMYEGKPADQCLEKIAAIEETLNEIFERSKRENSPPSEIADAIGNERLSG